MGCPELRAHVAAGAPGWCRYRGRAAWCARGRRPARSPSAPRASLGASSRSPARPCRRPRALQPGPLAASALALAGFSPREAAWRRVADVSDPRVAKFPSFGGGEVVVSGSAVPALWPPRGGRLVCAWALLLVALTRSCAAGPDRWQCGRPAWTTTCGVNLRMKGPKQPPVRPMVPPLEPMRPPLN